MRLTGISIRRVAISAEALVTLVTLVTLVACHRGAVVPPIPPAAVHAFGDTRAFGTQLVKFDAKSEKASVALKVPAYVIVLAVMPGRSIELISPGENEMVSAVPTGTRHFDLQQRSITSTSANQALLGASDMREVNNCVRRGTAAAEAARPRQPVVRDSTGKIISGGQALDPIPVDRYAIESRCQHAVRSSVQGRPQQSRPKREPGERYLVVLASPFPLPASLLNERLETLITTAPNVATTIEAIAQGLFAGFPGTWSGFYTAWQ